MSTMGGAGFAAALSGMFAVEKVGAVYALEGAVIAEDKRASMLSILLYDLDDGVEGGAIGS